MRALSLSLAIFGLSGCYLSHERAASTFDTALPDAAVPDAAVPDTVPPLVCPDSYEGELASLSSLSGQVGFDRVPDTELLGVVTAITENAIEIEVTESDHYTFRWLRDDIGNYFGVGQQVSIYEVAGWHVARGESDWYSLVVGPFERDAAPEGFELSALGLNSLYGGLEFEPDCAGRVADDDACVANVSRYAVRVESGGMTALLRAGDDREVSYNLVELLHRGALSIDRACGAGRFIAIVGLVHQWTCIC